jgi:hypothetical protein
MRVSVDPPLAAPVEHAITRLLRESRELPGAASYARAWREAALREGVERSDEEPGYALSPRSTRGAMRA